MTRHEPLKCVRAEMSAARTGKDGIARFTGPLTKTPPTTPPISADSATGLATPIRRSDSVTSSKRMQTIAVVAPGAEARVQGWVMRKLTA